MRIVDTNIILRYVLRDLEDVYAEVETILGETQVFIPLEIIAEVVYVLENVYKMERQDIRRMLETLCAYKKVKNADIHSFDKRLKKALQRIS
ncbi:MAG: type II toxin-antitoxin system VapC family toxin [bacterium]|nr:type II toxin-antitoxin system VapC family toxin [bacterium]